MKGLILIFSLVFALTACSVTKDWQATGGSKSDGTVKLSYQEGQFESVTVDNSQALKQARKRCQAWGYQDAEAFGGEIRQCNSATNMGCNSYLVTREYQCLDQ